ncbi:hypothetical protein HYU11_05495 [Candidatus Woesearchaeota archaeon]|nr:hypothetical protein [Candidatus Woesearchaeota archaeon]
MQDLSSMIGRAAMGALKPYAIVMHPSETVTVQEKKELYRKHPFYSAMNVRIMKGLILTNRPNKSLSSNFPHKPTKLVACFLDGECRADLYYLRTAFRERFGLRQEIDDLCTEGAGCISPFTVDYSKLDNVFFSSSLDQKALYDMPLAKDISVVCLAGRVVNTLRNYYPDIEWFTL